MNKRTLMVGSIIFVALVLVVSIAAASSRFNVAGQYLLGEPVENVTATPQGANCIIEADLTYPFLGDLVGEAKVHFRVLVHGPCEQADPFAFKETYWGKGTFTGEAIMGKAGTKAGTFDFDYKGKGWPAPLGEQAVQAQIRVISGTGELENLHGKLDVTYIMGEAFDSYDGWLRFSN